MEDLETPTPSLKSFDIGSETEAGGGRITQPRKTKNLNKKDQNQPQKITQSQQPQIITSHQGKLLF